jgi:hypothetical protein
MVRVAMKRSGGIGGIVAFSSTGCAALLSLHEPIELQEGGAADGRAVVAQEPSVADAATFAEAATFVDAAPFVDAATFAGEAELADLSGGNVTVSVHTFNQADNSEITGLWTVVDDAGGVEHTGYSPLSLTLPTGTISISVADYQQYHFNHWDDWTSARPRSITVTGNTWIGGWYAVQ